MTTAAALAGVPRVDASIVGLLRLYSLAMATATPKDSARTDADARDVACAQGGDRDAFASLVARHQDTISRQMWRFTRDVREHEELVQDVFVNAYLSLEGFRGDGPFLHWLRKIAVRTGYALWRREKRRRGERQLDPELAGRLRAEAADAEPSEAAELVHGILAQLPRRDRAVLTLLFLDECRVAETAELLGWSRGMVKVQAWRARKKMAKLFRAAGITDEGGVQ